MDLFPNGLGDGTIANGLPTGLDMNLAADMNPAVMAANLSQALGTDHMDDMEMDMSDIIA